MIISNFDEVRRGHELFLARNARLLNDSANMAGRFAVQYVHENSDFKRRSGKLQDSTSYRLVRTSGGRIVRIVNPQKYADIIDTKGSRPHMIYPKQVFARGRTVRGSALAFVGRAGVMIFRRSVKHPGTRPYRFLWNATDAAFRVLGHELTRGMSDIAEHF